MELTFPFIVDPVAPEGMGPPPDFNCPQYVEDIMPIYASNADPRQFVIDLGQFFFIPSTGISFSVIPPADWATDPEAAFVDVQLDQMLLRINTDNRLSLIHI